MWGNGKEIDDYDPDASSCECTWRCFETFCEFSQDVIEEMKSEDIYCPFWEIEGSWIDITELGWVLHDG